MSARRTTARDRITVAKDLILFTAGLVLIFRQGWFVARADFNWIVFAFGVALTQAPGAMAMISLARTGGDSSSPAPPAGLPPSPLPLPSTPGEQS